MAGGKRRWLKSLLKGNSGSSSSPSEGQVPGASSPATNAASGSVVSLPSGSSKHDSNSITPTDAHRIHAATISGVSPIMPELLQSRQEQGMAPENSRVITEDSQVSQSSAHAVVRNEPALHGGKFTSTCHLLCMKPIRAPGPNLLAPSTAARGLDSAFEGTGLREGLHSPGKKELSTFEFSQNTPVLEGGMF